MYDKRFVVKKYAQSLFVVTKITRTKFSEGSNQKLSVVAFATQITLGIFSGFLK